MLAENVGLVFIAPPQGLRVENRETFLTQAVGLGFASPPLWGFR
jgi:hypothetical protein